MKFLGLTCLALHAASVAYANPVAQPEAVDEPAGAAASNSYVPRAVRPAKHLRPHLERRDGAPGFPAGQPYDGKGKGDIFSGGTNQQIDLSNPSNLGAESTDAGVVTNLKWAFSDSHTRLLKGGWTRTQVVTDLPSSKTIAGAQQHLTKGSHRELHWHRVAEWGYVYAGEVVVSAVDENGRNQVEQLGVGDIWYFPKGQAHTIQGLQDHNEYLLVFDDGDFERTGTTFMVDDWVAHTPKRILAKNFGVNESVFDNVPATDPYILHGTLPQGEETPSPNGKLEGDGSYVYRLSQKEHHQAPGGGGTLDIVDSRNFPVSTTIAAAVVTLKPGALRELHWHPNAEEWLYFVSGNARATVFIGSASARTFDFTAGDTAVFPDNSGHYIENTSQNETVQWLEIYKSERAADISLTQWLALTPDHVVADTLNITLAVVQQLKTEKQQIVA